MTYRVRAVPREGHDGRSRSGRRFYSAHWTELADHEMTPEIRTDPFLIVERITPETAMPEPHLDLERVADAALLEELQRRGCRVGLPEEKAESNPAEPEPQPSEEATPEPEPQSDAAAEQTQPEAEKAPRQSARGGGRS